MPRRSAQDALSPFIPGKRRSPPAELDAREAKIWRRVTERLPSDWFAAGSGVMLQELCRHIRHADDLAADLALARAEIEQVKAEPKRDPRRKLLLEALKEYRALLRAHALQTQQIGTLSTRLRLTPQSRYAPSTAKAKAATSAYPAPWTDWVGGQDLDPDESGSDPEFGEPDRQKVKQ
jgi:hypothetical protein